MSAEGALGCPERSYTWTFTDPVLTSSVSVRVETLVCASSSSAVSGGAGCAAFCSTLCDGSQSGVPCGAGQQPGYGICDLGRGKRLTGVSREKHVPSD